MVFTDTVVGVVSYSLAHHSAFSVHILARSWGSLLQSDDNGSLSSPLGFCCQGSAWTVFYVMFHQSRVVFKSSVLQGCLFLGQTEQTFLGLLLFFILLYFFWSPPIAVYGLLTSLVLVLSLKYMNQKENPGYSLPCVPWVLSSLFGLPSSLYLLETCLFYI